MDTLHLSDPKPRMIAHRGLSDIEMENTCSAFVAAGNRSFFGIETDVHVTADGQFIIIHDDDTERVAVDALSVENSNYETLRALRLKDIDGKPGRRDLGLPSLQEYVQICKKYGKKSVLELKNHMEPQDIERIIQVIRDENWLEETIFISFDLPNMIFIREKLPHQKAQFLIEGKPDWNAVLEALKTYRLDLDIQFDLLTQERIQEVHALGQAVNAWTVNHLEDAQRLTAWGIDYITTNIIE